MEETAARKFTNRVHVADRDETALCRKPVSGRRFLMERTLRGAQERVAFLKAVKPAQAFEVCDRCERKIRNGADA